jgi:hypothetical protein
VFDLPPGNSAALPAPAFWPWLVMAAVVLLIAGGLWEQCTRTYDGSLSKTLEETQLSWPAGMPMFDYRLIPVVLMLGLGLLLVLAFIFFKYLAATDNLPQGDIVETAEGGKQEVLQGDGLPLGYLPFGPALAAGALLVAFYGPLLRCVAYWWLGLMGSGRLPRLPYDVMGQNTILAVLTKLVYWFMQFTAWVNSLLGGG